MHRQPKVNIQYSKAVRQDIRDRMELQWHKQQPYGPEIIKPNYIYIEDMIYLIIESERTYIILISILVDQDIFQFNDEYFIYV